MQLNILKICWTKVVLWGEFLLILKRLSTHNHNILINKLPYYGFRVNCQNLIKSFLTNRKQFVSINGYDSSIQYIQCGVPHTLGPSLFLIYINDLNFSIKSSTPSHFADDTCIVHHSNKLKTLETELNCDLKLCIEWMKVNRLSLNVDNQNSFCFILDIKILTTQISLSKLMVLNLILQNM